MAKTLRTLSDPDFTTKNNTLTWEELDQNQIDIWNEAKAALDSSDIGVNVQAWSSVLDDVAANDGSADLDLNSLDINNTPFVDSDRNITAKSAVIFDTVEIGANGTRRPVLSNSRVGAPEALTVQSSSGDVPGSVEIFPSGSHDRSHFLAGNTNDPDNCGYVKLEADLNLGPDNDSVAFLQGFTKGTATPPDQFHFRDFPSGVRFEDDVVVGNRLHAPMAVLEVDHAGSDLGALQVGDNADPTQDTGIYLRTTSNAFIRSGAGGHINFRPGDGDTTISLRANEDILTYGGDIKKNDFTSGWIAQGGDGYAIYQDSSATTQYNAEFNNLLIRGRMKVFELIVKQIATLGGTEILSVAVAEADSVSGSAGSETVTVTDPRGFGGTSLAADDLVIVQRVDINDATVVKQEFRTVSSITGTDATLTSTSGAPAPADAIEPGDIIVAYGNTTDTARQNMMYRSVEGELVSRFQTGVDSYADFNNPGATSNLILGDLTDAEDLSDGTTPTGFGMYAKGDLFLDGHIVAQTGKIANFEINANYLTDTNVYIGNNLNATAPIGSEGNIAIGNYGDGSIPILRAVGFGGTGNNYIQMRGATDATTPILDIRAGGNDVVKITSEQARFFGASADDTKLWLGETAGEYSGIQSGVGTTKSFFAGADDNIGTNANAYIRADGEIFYEGLGYLLYSKEDVAGFTSGDAANITTNTWKTTASSSGTGSSTSGDETKVQKEFQKKFGMRKIRLTGTLSCTVTTDEAASGTSTVTLNMETEPPIQTATVTTNTSSSQSFEIEIDVSSLSDGAVYTAQVELKAEVDGAGTNSAGASNEALAELTDDIVWQWVGD